MAQTDQAAKTKHEEDVQWVTGPNGREHDVSLQEYGNVVK